MRAVIDASVALKSVLNEQGSDKAQVLFEEFRQGLHSLIAPDIFRVEIAHALTRAERKKIIPVGHAAILFDDVIVQPPEFFDTAPLMAKAIEISSQTRTSVYDALYLCLAFEHNCEVVTADLKFIKALHQDFPFIVDLSLLP
jgi:predicted nucleic acid-binding protein